MVLMGRATREGTARFAERYVETAPGHFREACGWLVSSIGVGTYLGEPDETTDAGYGVAIETAVDMGCNVVDTAIVYRHQRSERMVGTTLGRLVVDGKCARDEIVVATKGGYLPHDARYPGGPRAYIEETLVRPGIISAGDVVAGSHCMTPRFLRSQLSLSRRNLDCEVVDVYLLHNPEAQLEEVGRREFLGRIRDAFAFLEDAVAGGEVGAYGTATWSGYRAAPGSWDHLDLDELVAAARDVAGDGHHFRAIQLPVNLAMPEAIATATQPHGGRLVPVLQAARDHDLMVLASASLMQARLTRNLPARVAVALGETSTDAQRALQFTRSLPGVTTALVGMSDPMHVVENCSLASMPPLEPAAVARLIG